MSDSPVNLSSGLPETVLPAAPEDATNALASARQQTDPREALSQVVARYPTFIEGWARLSEVARDDVEGYAYARVGYHRGLDALRKAGWKGSGYVRSREVTNQGFLRALDCLRTRAAAIGETDEATRCELFLHQLDPDWSGLA
jgi:hypothetical protein